jgi:hypothetical protein
MDVLGPDVTADLEALTEGWPAPQRSAVADRALTLARAGMPPAAALLVAAGVLLDD